MLSANKKEKLATSISTAVLTWEFVHHNVPALIESAVDEAVAACHRTIHREVKAFFAENGHIDIKSLNPAQVSELTGKLSIRINQLIGVNILQAENMAVRLYETVRTLAQCSECEEKIYLETDRLQSLLEYTGPRLCEIALDCFTPPLVNLVFSPKQMANRLFDYIFNAGLPCHESSANPGPVLEMLQEEIIRLYCEQATAALYTYLDDLMEGCRTKLFEAA